MSQEDAAISIALRLVDQATAPMTRAMDMVEKSTSAAERQMRSLSSATDMVAGAFATLTAGLSVAKVIEYADTYKNLEGRLNLVSASTNELLNTEKQLFTAAQDSRTGYAQSIDLYTKITRSTKELNLGQEKTLSVTDLINKTMVVSGASATEANAALTQLGQGLAAGALRGEEFNSVTEQTPRLAQAIADGMGVTIGSLRELSKEGALTSEVVIKAILSQGAAIESEFGKMPRTIGQAMTVLDNSIGKMISDADKVSGATGQVADKVIALARGVDQWSEENRDSIEGMLDLSGRLVDEVGGPIIKITELLALMTAGQWAFNLAVKSNPYIVAGLGIVGIGTYISEHLKKSGSIKQARFQYPDSAYGEALALAGEPLPKPAVLGNATVAPQRGGDPLAAKIAEMEGLRKVYEQQYKSRIEGEKKTNEAITKAEDEANKKRIEAIETVDKLKDQLREADAKAEADYIKRLTSLYGDYRDAMALTMSPQATAMAQIADRYELAREAVDDYYTTAYQGADALQREMADLERIDQAEKQALIGLTEQHRDSADEVETVWDSALSGLDRGFDEFVRTGELSASSVRHAFGSAIRGIEADWLKGMATMDMHSAKMQSIGGTAGIYSTIAGSDSGYAGLLSGGVGIVNELFNPDSYASALGGLQTNMAWGLEGLGFSDAAFALDGMSSSAFGAGTAGLGTFVMGLLSGKDFTQAAASGVGSAAGAYFGSMIMPGIGTILGSIAGSFLGDMIGGSDELEFSLNELNPHIDSSYQRNAGLDAPDWTEPDGARPTTTYLTAIDQLQDQFEAQAAQLGDSMTDAAAEAFFGALEVIDLTPDADGRWGVSQTQEALTEVLTNYGTKLSASLTTAIQAAIPAIAEEMTVNNPVFALLTDEMQAKIHGLISSDSFGLDQLGQLNSFFSQISQAMAPIDEIIATKGLSEYELSIRGINQQFGAHWAQLKSVGVDLARDTRLLEAWGAALEEVNSSERQRLAQLELEQTDDAFGLAATALNNAANAERNRLTESHTDLLTELNEDLSTVNDTIADLSRSMDAVHRARLSMDLGSDEFARDRQRAAQDTLVSALQAARAGDFDVLKTLDDSLNVLARPTQELYASMEDYQRDYWKTYLALAEIEALTGDQVSVEERMAASLERQISVENEGFAASIGLLDQQLNALQGIDASIISLAEAMARYAEAKNAVLTATSNVSTAGTSPEQLYLQQNQDVAAAVAAGDFTSGLDHYLKHGQAENRDYQLTGDQLYLQQNPDVAAAVAAGDFSSGAEHWLKHGKDEDRIYGFATGGSFMVGGSGGTDNLSLPGLRVSAGEMVHITRPDSMQGLAQANREMVAELRALRDEITRANEDNRRLTYQIAKNTGTVADNTNRWEFDKLNVQVVSA